jgi:hypothetical protein
MEEKGHPQPHLIMSDFVEKEKTPASLSHGFVEAIDLLRRAHMRGATRLIGGREREKKEQGGKARSGQVRTRHHGDNE